MGGSAAGFVNCLSDPWMSLSAWDLQLFVVNPPISLSIQLSSLARAGQCLLQVCYVPLFPVHHTFSYKPFGTLSPPP